MLFGIARLIDDRKVNAKFIGVREIKYPVKEKEIVKIEKERVPLYQINIKKEKLFVTIIMGKGIPTLCIASNIDLLLRQIDQLEKDLKEEMEE